MYFSHLIGQKFDYELDANNRGVFELTKWRISLMQWLVPTQFRGDKWLRIADIVWKPGKFSFLYFNGRNKFIAINDTILSADSVVQKEYELSIYPDTNNESFGWDPRNKRV